MRTVIVACAVLLIGACSSPGDAPTTTGSTVARETTVTSPGGASTTTTTPSAGEPVDRFAGFTPCDAGGAPGAWVCATLEVPIDRVDPGAGSIALKVWARPHTDLDAPPADPIFAPPAGPGAYALDNPGAYWLPQVLGEGRDIILLDPRGTGESGVIDCPDLQDGFDDLSQWAALTGECGAQLGDASDRYGAADRAMDVEAVRDWLGYERIVFYGHSFSGVDAQAYAARWPERLSAMVLDATFPLTANHWPRVAELYVSTALRVADLACSEVASCAEKTDDPGGTLSATVTRIAEAPLRGVATDGTDVVVDETYLLEAAREMDLPSLVSAAADYVAGDAQPLLDYAAGNPSWYKSGGYEANPAIYSGGADVAGFCKEPLDPWDPSDPIDVRRAELDAAVAELPDDIYAPWSIGAVALYSYFDQCVEWPAPDQDSESAILGATNTTFPVLVLAGDRDRIVPMAQSQELLEFYPKASFVVIPGVDHPALSPNDLSAGLCVAELIADFVETLEPIEGVQCA